MDVASYLYPWDVLDDPAAADLIGAQGFDYAVLAAHYHATRALTPRHPEHRIVTATHSAAYYPTSDQRWADSPLRPAAAGWLSSPDSFGDTVTALDAVDLPVHAWVVLLHRDPAAGQSTDYSVINAYGDPYSWALCPSQPAVRDYAAILAAEVAGRPGVAGLELEACGWYGFDHLSSHDKTSGVSLSAAEQYLFSLCFCPACARQYAEHGVDAAQLAARVRTQLDAAVFQPVAGGELDGDETAQIAALLGPDLAAAVGRMRLQVADDLRAEVVAAARSVVADLEISLHADARAHRTLAYTGVDPVTASRLVDRLITNCWSDSSAVAQARAEGAGSVHANLLAVRGMGGRLNLLDQAERARQAGADGIRLYHAGLATTADLAAMTELIANLSAKGGSTS